MHIKTSMVATVVTSLPSGVVSSNSSPSWKSTVGYFWTQMKKHWEKSSCLEKWPWIWSPPTSGWSSFLCWTPHLPCTQEEWGEFNFQIYVYGLFLWEWFSFCCLVIPPHWSRRLVLKPWPPSSEGKTLPTAAKVDNNYDNAMHWQHNKLGKHLENENAIDTDLR